MELLSNFELSQENLINFEDVFEITNWDMKNKPGVFYRNEKKYLKEDDRSGERKIANLTPQYDSLIFSLSPDSTSSFSSHARLHPNNYYFISTYIHNRYQKGILTFRIWIESVDGSVIYQTPDQKILPTDDESLGFIFTTPAFLSPMKYLIRWDFVAKNEEILDKDEEPRSLESSSIIELELMWLYVTKINSIHNQPVRGIEIDAAHVYNRNENGKISINDFIILDTFEKNAVNDPTHFEIDGEYSNNTSIEVENLVAKEFSIFFDPVRIIGIQLVPTERGSEGQILTPNETTLDELNGMILELYRGKYLVYVAQVDLQYGTRSLFDSDYEKTHYVLGTESISIENYTGSNSSQDSIHVSDVWIAQTGDYIQVALYSFILLLFIIFVLKQVYSDDFFGYNLDTFGNAIEPNISKYSRNFENMLFIFSLFFFLHISRNYIDYTPKKEHIKPALYILIVVGILFFITATFFGKKS